MDRKLKIGFVLIALSVVLFTIPAVSPAPQMRYHETWQTIGGNESQIEQRGATIVEYEDLSERGQDLYVATLRNDGRYSVPAGQGAPEFPYPTEQERAELDEEDEQAARMLGVVVIERPEDDSDLPPADERPPHRPDEEEIEGEFNETAYEQRRQQVLQYDMMETRTGPPPLSAPSNLLRLVAVLLAVLSLGIGGYLLSWKR
jgi:hypothetical protein